MRYLRIVLLLLIYPAIAHVPERPDLNPWFEKLRSGKGLCCSNADGSVVTDADWESRDGHYRVRIQVNKYGSWVKEPTEDSHAEWVDVPDEAVITEPNQFGRTMVWPMYLNGHVQIRCFMPGSEG